MPKRLRDAAPTASPKDGKAKKAKVPPVDAAVPKRRGRPPKTVVAAREALKKKEAALLLKDEEKAAGKERTADAKHALEAHRAAEAPPEAAARRPPKPVKGKRQGGPSRPRRGGDEEDADAPRAAAEAPRPPKPAKGKRQGGATKPRRAVEEENAEAPRAPKAATGKRKVGRPRLSEGEEGAKTPRAPRAPTGKRKAARPRLGEDVENAEAPRAPKASTGKRKAARPRLGEDEEEASIEGCVAVSVSSLTAAEAEAAPRGRPQRAAAERAGRGGFSESDAQFWNKVGRELDDDDDAAAAAPASPASSRGDGDADSSASYDAVRIARRLHAKAVAAAAPAMETAWCGRSDADFAAGSVVSAIEGREAWLGLLPEMVAVCNEAARRAALRRDASARLYDEPLSADYVYERVALAEGEPRGLVAREAGENGRLQGFVVVVDFCTFSKTLRWDSRHVAALAGTFDWSHGAAQARRRASCPPRGTTAAECLAAAEKLAKVSADHELRRRVDVTGELADCLAAEASRACGPNPMSEVYGEQQVWPGVAEVALLGGLGCGGRLLRLALERFGEGRKLAALQATHSAVEFYERCGFTRVGAVARFRDRADAPLLAYRHWTRRVDEASYMMALPLEGAVPTSGPAPPRRSPRSRALELAHVSLSINVLAPGGASAFRECLLLAAGLAGRGGAGDSALAHSLALAVVAFRADAPEKAFGVIRDRITLPETLRSDDDDSDSDDDSDDDGSEGDSDGDSSDGDGVAAGPLAQWRGAADGRLAAVTYRGRPCTLRLRCDSVADARPVAESRRGATKTLRVRVVGRDADEPGAARGAVARFTAGSRVAERFGQTLAAAPAGAQNSPTRPKAPR
ncbi:hypothetical protein M885DRAFT_529095 [Pelagophyceae sp. CCMP2097]|nr:hypothetical protein M885DRAFT_529095 [Pelagophyceae sp. CCMP2097]